MDFLGSDQDDIAARRARLNAMFDRVLHQVQCDRTGCGRRQTVGLRRQPPLICVSDPFRARAGPSGEHTCSGRFDLAQEPLHPGQVLLIMAAQVMHQTA